MPLPRTLEEYCAIQVAAMKRWVIERPALEFVVLTIHDNNENPVFTRTIRRTFSGGAKE